MSASIPPEPWTPRERLILTELYEADLITSEIASRLNREERYVQQHINEHRLQRVAWTEDDDNLLESLWRQDQLAKNIGYQLEHPRSEIAVCIRASQLDLPRRGSEHDGASYTAGTWTKTGDAYLLQGVANGLSDDEIQEKFFPNTRSVRAVESRRRELHRLESAVDGHQRQLSNTMAMRFSQLPEFNHILQPGQTIREVYLHMIIHHTTLSDKARTDILNLIEDLGWPTNVQAEEEIGSGSWNGLQSAWSDANNRLLRALRSDYNLQWKEIADAFFVDRLEKELERQYEMLQTGDDVNNSVLIE
ncbi:hypothetical protein M3J07_013290 [Ascochyta lentis]